MNYSQSIPTDKLHLAVELLTMCKALNGDMIYANFIVDTEIRPDMGFRASFKMPDVMPPNITTEVTAP